MHECRVECELGHLLNSDASQTRSRPTAAMRPELDPLHVHAAM